MLENWLKTTIVQDNIHINWLIQDKVFKKQNKNSTSNEVTIIIQTWDNYSFNWMTEWKGKDE